MIKKARASGGRHGSSLDIGGTLCEPLSNADVPAPSKTDEAVVESDGSETNDSVADVSKRTSSVNSNAKAAKRRKSRQGDEGAGDPESFPPQGVSNSPPRAASRAAGDRAGDPVGVRVESEACRGDGGVGHPDARGDSSPDSCSGTLGREMFGEQDGGESSGAPSATAKRARDDGSDQVLSEAKWRAVESERANGASGSADAQNEIGDLDITASVQSCQRESLGVAGQGECLYGGKSHPHAFTP